MPAFALVATQVHTMTLAPRLRTCSYSCQGLVRTTVTCEVRTLIAPPILPSENITRSADVALKQRRALSNARPPTTPRARPCPLSDNATFSSTLHSDNAASSPTPRPDNAPLRHLLALALIRQHHVLCRCRLHTKTCYRRCCAWTTPADSKLYLNVHHVVVLCLANAVDCFVASLITG